MLAIEIEFLMGRAVLSRWEDRSDVEWPPHPQRLFSSLVSAHSELEGDAASERALRWLEGLKPPEIKACVPSVRTSSSCFVPVNDEAVKAEKGRADSRHVLERRNRQERFFPTAVPADPVVIYQWPDTPGLDQHRDSLRRLVEGMTYLGHSSSPVRACLSDNAVAPSLRPTPSGDLPLRVPGVGRFDRLQQTHQLRIEDESIQPPLGRIEYYASPDVAYSVFDHRALVVAMDGGPRVGLDSTLPLMQHVRNAVLSRLSRDIPEAISGHDLSGAPSRNPHLAIVPLPFVGTRYADGAVKGIAFILPSNVESNVRRRLRSALSGPWQLQLGPLGGISIRLLDDDEEALQSLSFRRYTRTCDAWATVTPIVLDRHPKKKGPAAEDIIMSACERIGLPRPLEVHCGPVSTVLGVPRAKDFHGRATQVDHRLRLHATLRFEKQVRGPVLIGAGRFTGLGLCQAMPAGKQ